MWANSELFLFIFDLFTLLFKCTLNKACVRTRGRRIVGADGSSELWRPPQPLFESFMLKIECTKEDPIYNSWDILFIKCSLWSDIESKDGSRYLQKLNSKPFTIANMIAIVGSRKWGYCLDRFVSVFVFILLLLLCPCECVLADVCLP